MNAQETSCSKFNDEILQHEKEVSQLEKDILMLQEELLECNEENVEEDDIDQAVYEFRYQSCTLLHTHTCIYNYITLAHTLYIIYTAVEQTIEFLLYVPVIRKFLSWTYENNSHALGCHNKTEQKLYCQVSYIIMHIADFSSLLFQLYDVCICMHVTLNLHKYSLS